MKAVLCPVCNGFGQVSAGFYNHEGITPTTDPEICRSCNGKGWLEVGNTDGRLKPIDNISYSQPPDNNRCPTCGNDRNSPAGTGCPRGSHSGSYCSVQ